MNNSPYSIYKSVYSTKLPKPQEVDEWFEESHERYCAWISEVNGVMMLRTFAARYRKGTLYESAEIGRRLENDCCYVVCSMDWHGMAGWVIDWNHWDDRLWAITNKDAGWFYGRILNADEILKQFPYCQWETVKEDGCIQFFKYLSLYKRNPKLELLVKAGYSSMLTGLRYLNLNAKSLDKILKVKPNQVEFLKGKGIDTLLAVRKLNTTDEEYIRRYLQIKHSQDVRNVLKYSHSKQFIDYIYENCQHFRNYIIRDYYNTCDLMGVPMNEKRYLMPEDIEKAHDEITAQYEIVRQEAFKDKMEIQYKSLSKFNFTEKDLLIRPCESPTELINESKVLCHCVKTYAESYANGRTGIFFIRKAAEPETPYVTLEMRNNRVIQVRGYKNNAVQPLEETVKQFVSDWSQQFKLAYTS